MKDHAMRKRLASMFGMMLLSLTAAAQEDILIADFEGTDYGEWKIVGIAPGDVRDDNVPAELEEWAVICSKAYILPMLDPRKRLVLSTVI